MQEQLVAFLELFQVLEWREVAQGVYHCDSIVGYRCVVGIIGGAYAPTVLVGAVSNAHAVVAEDGFFTMPGAVAWCVDYLYGKGVRARGGNTAASL